MSPIGAKVIERATGHVLSRETCYRQCEIVALATDSDGVTSHPDDALLLAMLDAAVDHAEKFTGRSIAIRTYEFALDDFPRAFISSRTLQPSIEIPYPPFIDAINFAYGDDSDSALEEGVDYVLDSYGDKAQLRSVSSWPSLLTASPNRVVFRYRAGYQSEEDPDSDAEPLPAGIRAAILLMLAHLYENRAASSEKAMQELPLGVEALLRPWRVLLGMA